MKLLRLMGAFMLADGHEASKTNLQCIRYLPKLPLHRLCELHEWAAARSCHHEGKSVCGLQVEEHARQHAHACKNAHAYKVAGTNYELLLLMRLCARCLCAGERAPSPPAHVA